MKMDDAGTTSIGSILTATPKIDTIVAKAESDYGADFIKITSANFLMSSYKASVVTSNNVELTINLSTILD